MTDYTPPAVEDVPLWDIWLSMYQLPATAVADEKQIFVSLAAQPATHGELAQRLDLDPRGTRVLLDMLTAIGLLAQRDGVFALTALASTYLLPDSAFYWGPLLRALGVLQPIHDTLLRALASQPVAAGRPAESWARGSIEPAVAERVSRVMHCHSLPAAIGVATLGGFDRVHRLLDVGGGSGCFSIALAQRYPQLHCTVMELPAVCEVANRYIADGGVSDRVDTRAVDMFRDDWPTGYDAILFSNIFHDWDPPINSELARRSFAALPAGGTIFLHEMLLDEDRPSPTAAGFSMLMLVSTRGHQYRLSELRDILSGVGFARAEARATHGRYSIVSAVKG